MRALLIDTKNKTVTEVSHEGDLESLYKLIGCEMVEAPIQFDNHDTLYCDEEAWLTFDLKDGKGGFSLPNFSYPILGNALITGLDEDGNDIDAKTSIEDLSITWYSPEEMKEMGIKMGMV